MIYSTVKSVIVALFCVIGSSASAVTVSYGGVDYFDIEAGLLDMTVSNTDPIVFSYYIETVPLYDPTDPMSGGEYVYLENSSYSVNAQGFTTDGDFFLREDRRSPRFDTMYSSRAVGTTYDATGYTRYDLFQLTVDLSGYVADESITTDFVTYDVGQIGQFSTYVNFYSEVRFFEYIDFGYGPEYSVLDSLFGSHLKITYVAPTDPTVAPVPVPAGGMMLLSALGLLGWRALRA